MANRPEDDIEALHRVATRLQSKDTVEAVCEQTVSAAAGILDFHQCTALIREGEWLVPYATSEDTPSAGSRRMRVNQGLAGKTYQTGSPHIVETVDTDDVADPAKEVYQSGISVPIGEHGVFQAVSTDTAAFDDDNLEVAELLVNHTTTALDRIERERELQAQVERLDQFASVVSHDLRNPLNVAITNLDLVDSECESPYIEEVATAHERMETLIDDLLTFARVGTEAIDPAPVDLPSLLADTRSSVDESDATLNVRTDQVIRADPSRLRQLVENLLSNAVDHGGTDVSVTVGDLDDGFYVEDDGPGIPVDERDDVFEAGYSLAEEGTGFGLSIVEQAVRAHGWQIRVTDTAEGGARFEITGVETAE